MPSYAVAQPGGLTPPSLNIAAMFPGDGVYFLFNAEAPLGPPACVVIERGQGPAMNSDDGIFASGLWLIVYTCIACSIEVL
jgi:hypothetical protein